MRCASALALFAALSLVGTSPAVAAVKVVFANKAHYTDAKQYDVDAKGAISAHLQRLGARYLGSGATLTVTVLDLDLAGQDLSTMGPSRLRVYNGATPPKIRLRYRLERNHKVVAAGEDSLSDQSYQSRPDVARSSDVLRYEKAMLDDWFREKFARRR
jgi:hypothetical protein